MKLCIKCGELKEKSQFNNNNTRYDGLQVWCRVCQARNHERRKKVCPEKLAAESLALKNNPLHRETNRAGHRRWNAANKGKTKVHNEVYRAIKAGDLVKPDACEVCDYVKPLDAHHFDYESPMVVVWLCRQCHQLLHAGLTPEANLVKRIAYDIYVSREIGLNR